MKCVTCVDVLVAETNLNIVEDFFSKETYIDACLRDITIVQYDNDESREEHIFTTVLDFALNRRDINHVIRPTNTNLRYHLQVNTGLNSWNSNMRDLRNER